VARALLIDDTVVSALAPAERRRAPKPVSSPVTVQSLPLSPTPSVAATPRHAFRAIEGVRLHWVEYGALAVRAPVVLLHGLNDSHLTWRQIAPVIARGRHVR
jgi:hypothetical protein